jgi:hypothetical protein
VGHLIAIFNRVHVSANSNPDWTRDSQSVADFENLFCVYLQVDGSHLPPCFGDKDVLTRLKIGISFRSCQVLFHGSLGDILISSYVAILSHLVFFSSALYVWLYVQSKCKISLLFSSTNSSVIAHAICQPTSPQGQKRGKRTSDGESVSEDEEAIEDGEPNSKRGKHEDEKLTKGTIGGTRGRRRSIDKNGSVKKPGKKPRISDSEDDSSKDQEVNLSLKQKQGSPVNMGTPSGQELAAPSISTTKVKNRKTAEQSTQEFVQKRSVHEAKAKQVEKNEQDGQDGVSLCFPTCMSLILLLFIQLLFGWLPGRT